MEKIKSKWHLRLAVVVIFLLGFVAGMLTINLYHVNRSIAASKNRRHRFEQMLKRLGLTEEQQPKVEKILSDARAQFKEIRKESEPRQRELRAKVNDQLQAVLTPEQWQQYQK